MTALYAIPPLLLLIVALVVGVSLASAGQIFVHRRFSSYDFVHHNDVAGFIIAVVGTLYAVVLGFLTVVVWQHFADSRVLVALEAAAAADAWHTAVGMPKAERSRVRQDILQYANIMVNDEWPQMRRGSYDRHADFTLMDAITATGGFNPANLRESNAQAATMQQLSALHDGRQRRLSANSRGVSGFEWLVLFIGATCLICFCWLFGMNSRAHLLMTAAVTIVVVAMLVLLFELQYPFRSSIGVGDDIWRSIVQHIQLMNAGTQSEMRM